MIENIIGNILVLDDEQSVLNALKRELRDIAPIFTAKTIEEARNIINQEHISLVISDYRLPDGDGLTFLSDLRLSGIQAERMLITAYSDESLAIDAINSAGIFCYIRKPWDSNMLKIMVKRGMESFIMNNDIRHFKSRENKLDELKKSVIAIVSHELNTPLTTAKGYAEMLSPFIAQEAQTYYKRLTESLLRIESFIVKLKEISELEYLTLINNSEEINVLNMASYYFEQITGSKILIKTNKDLLFGIFKSISEFYIDSESSPSLIANENGKFINLKFEAFYDKLKEDKYNIQPELFETLETNVNIMNYIGKHGLELSYVKKATEILGGNIRLSINNNIQVLTITLPTNNETPY